MSVFSSISDESGNSISTGIICRPWNSVSLDCQWECYFYEISKSDIEGGRDIFVDFHHLNGGWTRHYYRPFHPDRGSLENLKKMVSNSKIVRWHNYYNDSCSTPVRVIHFVSPTDPKAIAGCYVTKIIPAKNKDLLFLKAVVPDVKLSRALETPCNVAVCSVCNTSGTVVFDHGDYIKMDFSPYQFAFDSNQVSIHSRFLPILEPAYRGNIVMQRKNHANIIYLAVPYVFTSCNGDYVELKFPDFSIYFLPIPSQAFVHPLSTFFETLMSLDGWIQYNDQLDVFIMRDDVFQNNLLHQSRHLILFDINSRTADTDPHVN